MKKDKLAKRDKKVSAIAKAAGFEIEIHATIRPKGLAEFEVGDVQRSLRHQLAAAVSKLPFSEIYPNEVKVR